MLDNTLIPTFDGNEDAWEVRVEGAVPVEPDAGSSSDAG